ncbi:MAG TPA: GNAT family N-acetyltransferase [Pseudonocardia sp.]|nr:GNAT family N-acetyltransferase [Pseudonocardia sp.]
MGPEIRKLVAEDHQPVVDLSLRAWEPVFASIEHALAGSGVYPQLFPDWREDQRRAVLDVCSDAGMHVWVAELDAVVVGFAATRLHDDGFTGEIYMLAVDPDHQRRGVGAALTSFSTRWIADQGMSVALVETGGDPGHAPARRVYERAGYTPLPAVRYYKKL